MAREEAITTKIEESVQHGDLEVFLLGLQLGDHLQIFQKHHITFSTLLCMTEEDLKQVCLLFKCPLVHNVLFCVFTKS